MRRNGLLSRGFGVNRLEQLLQEGKGNIKNFGGKKAPPFKKEEGRQFKVRQKVWVKGDEDVGMHGYEALVVRQHGDTVVVKDKQGNEDEVSIKQIGESNIRLEQVINELSASEEEMAPVDKDVYLDGGMYLVKRYHIITTRHVVYAAYEKADSIVRPVGKKTGIEYSSSWSTATFKGGQIGTGLPEGAWDDLPVGSSVRSKAVLDEYVKQYQRAYALIKRAFPEAGKLARPDDSEMTFTLTGDPHLYLPDLRQGFAGSESGMKFRQYGG